MSLKPDRQINVYDITKTCNDAHEAGSILCFNTSASGGGMQTLGSVTLASNPSGSKPAGLSLLKMVSIDQTRYHRNFHNQEQVVGENVSLMTKGYVVTNKVIGTPSAAGVSAYLSSSGNVTPTLHATGGLVATPLVGKFGGKLDEDGYARVDVDL